MKTMEEMSPGCEVRLREAMRKDSLARRLATSTAQTPLQKRPMPSLMKSFRMKPEKPTR